MNFQSFTVANLGLFLALLAVLAGALAYGRTRRARVLGALAAAPLDGTLLSSLHPGRRLLRQVLFFAGLFFIMLALCRPWWGYHLVPAPQQSRDLLFVVDTSRSMLAQDPPPSRLKHAKWWIRELVSRCPGDRFGLIAFAGDAFLECPLTQDAGTFLQLLEALDSGTIPVGGTNIAQALKTAEKAFAAAEGSHQAVILVTDGEEQQGTAMAETPWFRDHGVPLFTVGLGNPDSGAILQLEDNSLIRDQAGEPVKSRLNAAALRELAERTRGIFVHSTSLDANIEPVHRRVRELVPAESKQGIQRRPLERYQLPLLLGVLCLLARLLLGERRNAPVPVAAGKGVAALVTLLLLAATAAPAADSAAPLLPPEPFEAASAAPASAASAPVAAENTAPPPAAFMTIQGRIADLEQALVRETRESEKGRLRFNLGTAHHSQSEADAARKEYETVLGMNAREVPASLRAKACQNLGALDHAAARQSLQEKPDDAINFLKSSQSFYKEGLRLAPQNNDIAGNLEMSERDMTLAEAQKKKLEEMKKQSEQQQKEQKEKQEQAKNDTQQALEKQQQANQEQQPQQRGEKQQAANQATEKAKESTEKLNQNQPQREESKPQQAAKELDQARQEQKKTDPQSATPEEEKKAAGKKAEEHLKNALDKLNEAQKEQEKKDGGKKKDDAGQQGQKPAAQKPADGKQNEPVESQPKPAPAAQPDGQPSVDKQQAAAILRQMQEQERDYRDFIKQQQRKNSRMEEVEKNW